MKKIIALILLSFSLQSQTLIKLKQLENSGGTGSVVVTNTAGVLTYTGTLPTNVIPSLPYTPTVSGGYVPYSGANSFTTTNDITANAITTTTSSILGGLTSVTTLTASSTVTITGAAKLTNTLNTIGNTSLNTNQTNTLIGGNTGTIAVLSDALFNISCIGLGSAPADATNYYFGPLAYNAWLGVQGHARVYIPYNCTLVGWTANALPSVAASAESSTLAINIDNSPTNLSTSLSFTAITSYSASGLSININAGSYVEAKLTTPTWVTNPTGACFGVTFWFVRRQ